MFIKTRDVYPYINIEIFYDGTEVENRLFDQDELEQLINKFEEAIETLKGLKK